MNDEAVERALRSYPGIPLPAIEEFLEALGYVNQVLHFVPGPGEKRARLVAVFWDAGDEAYYDDGMTHGAAHYSVYVAYMKHPVMIPLLWDAVHTFGDSDNPPRNKLVLDRQNGRGYVVPVESVNFILTCQWPDPQQYSIEELEALEKHLAEMAQPRNRLPDLNRLLRQGRAARRNLVAALDSVAKGGM